MSDMNEEQNYGWNDEIYSQVIRAGKRTYYFDVRATKNDDLYLTISESKKSFQDGKSSTQKHKIFLYKEDFEKFKDALSETVNQIDKLKQEGKYKDNTAEDSDYSSLDFEDLQ